MLRSDAFGKIGIFGSMGAGGAGIVVERVFEPELGDEEDDVGVYVEREVQGHLHVGRVCGCRGPGPRLLVF